MLVLLTIVAAALAWKYNQRNRIIFATKSIEKMGGQVLYHRENPTAAMKWMTVTCHRRLRETRTRTLLDGTVENYDVFHIARSYTANVQVKSIESAGGANEEDGILNILGNRDILVDAAKIHESRVDADFVEHIQKLDGLRVVQVCRDIEYFRMKATDPEGFSITPEQKEEKLSELDKPFENAKSLIHNSLPEVDVIDGYLFSLPGNGG